ncbi:SAM-dependent chlorinase/fluorinase, partial [Escherichia coli]|uniref:SAM-dependent chlorinase/fluorinase n=1 Tax=Escherichia coli TaxID=562 RepID=UPI001592313F
IESVRQIDEKTNRLKGSEKSYTFHGRDVYAYTGARLASGAITFEQVGPELPAKVVELSYPKANDTQGEVKGDIPIPDIQYGNVWSNLSEQFLNQPGIKL